MKSIIGLNMLYSSLIAPSFAFDMMVNILVQQVLGRRS